MKRSLDTAISPLEASQGGGSGSSEPPPKIQKVFSFFFEPPLEPPPLRKLPLLQLSEVQPRPYRTDKTVGIEEYVLQDSKGFFAVLKERYSDFLVNEIDPSGQVAHLTELAFTEKKPEIGPKREAGLLASGP